MSRLTAQRGSPGMCREGRSGRAQRTLRVEPPTTQREAAVRVLGAEDGRRDMGGERTRSVEAPDVQQSSQSPCVMKVPRSRERPLQRAGEHAAQATHRPGVLPVPASRAESL